MKKEKNLHYNYQHASYAPQMTDNLVPANSRLTSEVDFNTKYFNNSVNMIPLPISEATTRLTWTVQVGSNYDYNRLIQLYQVHVY